MNFGQHFLFSRPTESHAVSFSICVCSFIMSTIGKTKDPVREMEAIEEDHDESKVAATETLRKGNQEGTKTTTRSNVNVENVNYQDNNNGKSQEDDSSSSSSKHTRNQQEDDKTKDRQDVQHQLMDASPPIMNNNHNNNNNKSGGGPPITSLEGPLLLSRLYSPDRVQKPAIWKHIRLVSPTGKLPIGQPRWRSRDAVAAYCLKCQKCFTNTTGTSKTILRHMIKYHGYIESDKNISGEGEGPNDSSKGTTAGTKRSIGKKDGPNGNKMTMRATASSTQGKSILSPPESSLKKRKIQGNSLQVLSTLHSLILKWLVESLRPVELLEDPGLSETFRFAFSMTDFKMPSPPEVMQLAKTKATSAKRTINDQLAAECDCFSLSAALFPGNHGRHYCATRITYLTPNNFERKSLTVSITSVTTEDPQQSSNEDVTTHAIQRTLTDFPCLSLEKMTGFTFATSLSSSGRTENVLACPEMLPKEKIHMCVTNTLNRVVREWLSADQLGKFLSGIRKLVKYLNDTSSGGGAKQWESLLAVDEVTEDGGPVIPTLVEDDLWRPKSTYLMLRGLLKGRKSIDRLLSQLEPSNNQLIGMSWMPTEEDWSHMEVLCTILQPFHDATVTLELETFPTVGLIIPVLRRVRDCLKKLETPSSVRKIKDKLVSTFADSFSEALETNPSNMWTIPLDPRLVLLRGLSEEEKLIVKKRLVQEVRAETYFENNATRMEDAKVLAGQSSGNTKYMTNKAEESTMGGLFLEDDEEFEGHKDNAAVSHAYAQASVDRYVHTVRSNGRIDDPLAWWKINHSHFPELSRLAQKWLCCSSAHMAGGHFFSGLTAQRIQSFTDNEQLEVLLFLHENR